MVRGTEDNLSLLPRIDPVVSQPPTSILLETTSTDTPIMAPATTLATATTSPSKNPP